MSECVSVLTVFVMIDQIYKYPRLYIDVPFSDGSVIALERDHVHYLRAVLRKGKGDVMRVFNGRDGEWFAEIQDLGKKQGSVILTEKIKDQSKPASQVHLFFAPPKKSRMDILIEKAVELGVDGLHPVITNRTENRNFKEERVRMQMIEAAEQSERLEVPVLYDPVSLTDMVSGLSDLDVPFYACIERGRDTKPISSFDFQGGAAFLIGPEGGFDDSEIEMLYAAQSAEYISLGERLLRCETAAAVCLSYACIR